MTDNNTTATQKIGFFKRVKAEFKKIVWPSREDVAKETIVVLIAAIVIGLLIAVVDLFLNYGIDFWVNL